VIDRLVPLPMDLEAAVDELISAGLVGLAP
jgi:hypothetical protein